MVLISTVIFGEDLAKCGYLTNIILKLRDKYWKYDKMSVSSEFQEDKMADDELEAIRAKRMAELQQQMVRMTLYGF